MDECVNGLQFCLLQIYFVFDLVFFHLEQLAGEFMMKTAEFHELTLHECPCITSPEENVHSYGHVHLTS